MNANGHHYSIHELNMLVDADRGTQTTIRTDPHLLVCDRCRKRYVQLNRIDRSLRSIALPETARGFTERIMKTLSRGARMPLAFRLLEHAASFLGTLVVLTIIVAAYLLFVSPAESGRDSAPLGLIARGWTTVSSGSTVAARWLNEHLMSLDGLGSLGVWVVSVIAVLVLLDRLLARRFFQKAR